MSEDLVNTTVVGLAVEQSIIDKPAEIERRLSEAVASVARKILDKPEVLAALAAAGTIPSGIVIAEEAAAVAVVDAIRTIIDGEKALEKDLHAVLKVPRAMEAAALQALRDHRVRLADAKARGNDARIAWQQECRRRSEADHARRVAEARKLAEKTAAEAALTGEDAPPVAEIATPEIPRTIKGGRAQSGTQVRVEAKEIVNDAECPPEWKVIVRAIAEGFFRNAELMGQVKRALPGESVVWRGVRFQSVERAVNR